MLSEVRLTNILGLGKSMQAKKNHFWKNLIVMTKFPDISLTLVKWPKFPDIFSKFPDNSLTWRKFCFCLTFPWHVATLTMYPFQAMSLSLSPSLQYNSTSTLLTFKLWLFLKIALYFCQIYLSWETERCTHLPLNNELHHRFIVN